ncbi:MAG: pilus assembly protein [Bdellovibrionales bacterium]|nr:pilus assembly protein [Bdellovibrionales bacterium]
MKRVRATKRGERGAAMVEAAIISSVLFVLIIAIVDLYAVLSIRSKVTSAAEIAGRSAMIRLSKTNDCAKSQEEADAVFRREIEGLPVRAQVSVHPEILDGFEVRALYLDFQTPLPCILCHSFKNDMRYSSTLTFVLENPPDDGFGVVTACSQVAFVP